jgi:Mg2+-importing ATPase
MHSIRISNRTSAKIMNPEKRNREFTYHQERRLFRAARKTPSELFVLLRSSFDGLSADAAMARQRLFGLNDVTGSGATPTLEFLWKAFKNPFNYLILTLSVVSYLTDDLRAAILMALMVLLSVALTFFQELRSSRAAEKLSAMVSVNVTVYRNKTKSEIPIVELVIGDIVYLSAGDMVPADIRLIAAKNLAVNQSALTGESIPVEKGSEATQEIFSDLPDVNNLCFMGSSVASGTSIGIVIHTGQETYFGSIAKTLSGARAPTSFDQGIQRFTHLMLKFMFVMVPLVFLINGFTKGNWSEAFLFAVAVAVGLTPEMLPMIVTANLAKGALAMSKKKVIVKRLNSIQNLGAMNVLCTDKTGTLTEDQVVFGGAYDPHGNPSELVLKNALLNSYFQTGLKNFLDLAIINYGESRSENAEAKNTFAKFISQYRLLDELPFDFSRKRMSVLVENEDGEIELICKGAVEEVLSQCVNVEDKFHETARIMNEDGLRVIAIASKKIPSTQSKCELPDERNLNFLGFINFLDPPAKDSAATAIQALARFGVVVKILTGDNERVTAKIAKEVGLSSGPEAILLGHQISVLSDLDLQSVVEKKTIFAKLSPDQKQRIIEALHARGHVVGFIGDGINDAPALRAADVGISVNNAVDIAKESADIILLEKDLMVLEQGVIEGRKVFGNILKYIKMGASSNFGNVFSMLGASSILPFLPMKPVQMLTQNLLYDFSQIGIPLDNVDQEYLEKPRKWEIESIQKFMLFIGPISSIFDYATFALMWFYFKANSPAHQSLFQTGWFIEGLLSQTLIVHMIRTRRIPFIQSRPSAALLTTTAMVMAIGIYLPFSSFGKTLGFVSPPGVFFFWLIGILISYCALTQVVKNWFTKRFSYY